jgi:gamma-glutamyltranspeptidase / glutathione hydrolase
MVATSQPLATRAGLRALERGGNAADAALAAAAVLCVTEPMATGIGGDCFAIVWDDGRIAGLDAAGPAPRGADPVTPVEASGPRSVTVPGAVGGWSALAERFGRVGLEACLADAIDAAEHGFAMGSRTVAAWNASRRPPELARGMSVGERLRQPELAATLRAIAVDGPSAFYEGRVAAAIASASWVGEDDLASYRPAWVKPLRGAYRGVDVLELPPPTQGVAALEGLALLEAFAPDLESQVHCVRLALEDALARVRDGADVSDLLEPERIAERRAAVPTRAAAPGGGTVYVAAVDGDGMAVSFIQSLFEYFGSVVMAPGTGVVLQNRGACFSVSGAVEPGRRPFHTIIPGMLLRDGGLLGPFGVVGGAIQAQAHVQVVSGLVDDGLDPQAALDRPRFRVEGEDVLLERGLWDRADDLGAAGIPTVCEANDFLFGGGQAILRVGDALVGGSDSRKDGIAAGF